MWTFKSHHKYFKICSLTHREPRQFSLADMIVRYDIVGYKVYYRNKNCKQWVLNTVFSWSIPPYWKSLLTDCFRHSFRGYGLIDENFSSSPELILVSHVFSCQYSKGYVWSRPRLLPIQHSDTRVMKAACDTLWKRCQVKGLQAEGSIDCAKISAARTWDLSKGPTPADGISHQISVKTSHNPSNSLIIYLCTTATDSGILISKWNPNLAFIWKQELKI